MTRLRLFSVVALLLAGMSALSAGWLYRQVIEQSLQPAGGQATYVLEPGSGASRFTRDLIDAGLITQPRWTRYAVRFYLRNRVIQAGEYQISDGMLLRELLENVLNGVVVSHTITFPEGWSFRQFRAALAAEKRLEPLTAGWDAARIMTALGEPGQHPEGRFFPDTYAFSRGARDLDVLEQAYRRMQKVLAEEWQKREEGLPYETDYEALIMASIVEKETGLASERAEIAGVFVRRLRRGMRLQTDPTVIYGLGDGYQGNITRRHLRTPTPYNTYVIHGLPPTPIAMPGRGAIHAALHPAPGKTLFFVARGDGSHQFSETLAEHEAAVKKYQIMKRAQNYRSAPGEQQR